MVSTVVVPRSRSQARLENEKWRSSASSASGACNSGIPKQSLGTRRACTWPRLSETRLRVSERLAHVKQLLRLDLPGLQFVAGGDDEVRLAVDLDGREAGDRGADVEVLQRLAVGGNEMQRAVGGR